MFKKLYYRMYQKSLYIAAHFVNYNEPKLLVQTNGLLSIPEMMKKEGCFSAYIVADPFIVESGRLQPLLDALHEVHINYGVYSKIKPNPTVDLVEDAYSDFYYYGGFDTIISVGGGSPMDLAKLVGIKSRYPKRSIRSFKGVLTVHKKLPLMIAVPTTVGTGSEATLAAVVTDATTKEKYAIMDPSLVPNYAILDDELVKDLPPHLISTTAMDALTHAIEAFIGQSTTHKTRAYAKEAVKTILNHIYDAYQGKPESIKELQLASYKAGVAFTRSYVGNVHAIAHQLGGFYNVAHGLANAIVLPHILRYYGKKVYQKLAILAKYAGICDKEVSIKDAAFTLIEMIESLNGKMNIPVSFNGLIKKEDIPALAKRAHDEANPLYPVPVIMNYDAFYDMYRKINEVNHA